MGDLNAFTKDDYSYRHWLVRLATFTLLLDVLRWTCGVCVWCVCDVCALT
jgi:hypothetical protein